MNQPNQVPPYKSAYRADIDGLRAFAVLSVVIFHAFPNSLSGGFIGVDIFFVISGFLITGHIFKKLDEGSFTFADFFSRRVRRIFPALILVMTSSLVFGGFVLLADEYAQLGKHVASGAAFIVNFVVAGEAGYFDNSAETKPMLHLWSLAVEEQFYIIWPLALWLAWKSKLNLLFLTILVSFASFFLNLKYVDSSPTETFFWSIGRVWELLSGSMLAWFMLYKKEWLSKTKLWIDQYLVKLLRTKDVLADGSTTSNLLSFSGISLLLYGVIQIHEGLAWPSSWALIPTLGAVLVIASGPQSYFNRLLLTNPIAIWFGLISYPLYLWHWPILSYLHIIDGELPHRDARIIAVLLSILFAWITYKLVESPIRFGRLKSKVSTLSIALALFATGACGYLISIFDLSKTNSHEKLLFERTGFEHKVGDSLKWYEGKDDWLFLGNLYDKTVAKLELAIIPTDAQIQSLKRQFTSLQHQLSDSETKFALLVGPNKSNIYKEFLPERLTPSEKRYSTYYTDALGEIPNFVMHDPTYQLLEAKEAEGTLYYRTDTHWNPKGAFIAYSGLLNRLELSAPHVQFKQTDQYRGDLIGISKLFDFPVHSDDSWSFLIKEEVSLQKHAIPNQPETTFGIAEVVKNATALNKMTVWVIGDSYTKALRPYLNATFQEVHYMGHWRTMLLGLPSKLKETEKKPDLMIVVRVERTF